MKKIVAFLMTFLMAFSLVACGDEEPVVDFDSGENIHTIVLMSDTQFYAKSSPETYCDMTKYLVDNKDKYSIEYVVHTGDMVQDATRDDEWANTKTAMSALDGKIPYGVLAGNHDQANGTERFTAFSQNFGDSFYEGRDYFGESYDNCRAMYQLITLGSTDFIFVYISDDPDKGCIDFANAALKKYSDRVGVICLHNYLDEDLSLDDMGEYVSENIVKPNPNVYMVLCGHNSATGELVSEFDDNNDGKSERTVHQIIADYQDSGWNGCMFFLQIDEKSNKLYGISYSPIPDKNGKTKACEDELSVLIPW